MEYSLWFIPYGKIQDTLKKVVEELAKKYDGPTFEPHLRAKIAREVSLARIKFTADKLIVVPSTENPSTWKHLAEIKL